MNTYCTLKWRLHFKNKEKDLQYSVMKLQKPHSKPNLVLIKAKRSSVKGGRIGPKSYRSWNQLSLTAFTENKKAHFFQEERACFLPCSQHFIFTPVSLWPSLLASMGLHKLNTGNYNCEVQSTALLAFKGTVKSKHLMRQGCQDLHISWILQKWALMEVNGITHSA